MNILLKITAGLLASVRADLQRPHQFAFERVGFLTAGAARVQDGLLLVCRSYHPIADEDYERSNSVGAQIGSSAMRKGIEAAYANSSSLIHIHTHGGVGDPEFSGVDLRSAPGFVPGFFNALPRMPHGLVVLSNDSARGLLWSGREDGPHNINGFVQVGSGVQKFGARA
ncbi:hypothetical protein [Variovorax atrisoli]|uniref:hypothetical protein n=1 Tax=Variovorax atrisoli TaxID=3394203 RepID=UPI00403FDC19